ncbi:hypothetical protein BLNAU_5760 [Blattamonas nauphoetae]|uniref:Uncharacterized protein n=1 Tax=Blattamonas nauphoetae TaxID=2049346 RepID=A0ABQ9Y614_9EUKA|nr:hypothetical protein BLNAU_5760 [Blattamonas nauphoetae]
MSGDKPGATKFNEVDSNKIWIESCNKEATLAAQSRKRWGFLIEANEEERTRELNGSQTIPVQERYYSNHFNALKTTTSGPSVQFKTSSSAIGREEKVDMVQTRHFHKPITWD